MADISEITEVSYKSKEAINGATISNGMPKVYTERLVVSRVEPSRSEIGFDGFINFIYGFT